MTLRSAKIKHQWKFFALLILWLPLSSFSMSAQQRTTNDQPFVPGSTNDLRTEIPIITVAEEKMFPQSWRSAPISARATNLSTREVQRSLEVLNRAMGKYPESFLHENIKRIYLLGSLNLYGVPCDGTVSSDSLYIVNGGGEEYTDEYIALISITPSQTSSQRRIARQVVAILQMLYVFFRSEEL